jgi:hypothetical protein
LLSSSSSLSSSPPSYLSPSSSQLSTSSSSSSSCSSISFGMFHAFLCMLGLRVLAVRLRERDLSQMYKANSIATYAFTILCALFIC